jgi:antitoxin component YwqK of YwqJK toxin-antitoxin module
VDQKELTMLRLSRPATSPWIWGLVIVAASSLARADESTLTAAVEPAPLPSAIVEDAAANDEVPVKAEGKGEVIRQLYDNRKLKVERHVSQDTDGSYFNHGLWQMWDPDGQLVACGNFDHGVRSGKWQRFFLKGEAELISGPIGSQFEAPFTSEAEFVGGKLHGKWTIVDAQQRLVISWNYAEGQRDGKSVWWFPNGNKWREVDYTRGQIDGTLAEWKPEGVRLARERYLDGRRVGVKFEWYEPGVKKVQAEFLFAREVSETEEDWWSGYSREKFVTTEGTDERHGPWTTYYRNGQKAMEGTYDHEQASGAFTWWHPNGQKAIEGNYENGLQTGQWNWWHTNGQKHIQGDYADGAQVGRWKWWNDEGKVSETASLDDASFGQSKLETLDTPPELQSTPKPDAPPSPKLKAKGVSRSAEVSTAKPAIMRTTIRPAARHG